MNKNLTNENTAEILVENKTKKKKIKVRMTLGSKRKDEKFSQHQL